MKAQQLIAPRRFVPVDVPAPTADDLADAEVLVDVIAGGVCGSDLPFFAGHPSPLFDDTNASAAGVAGFPLHEIIGDVVASLDDEIRVGDRVVGWATGTNALSERIITRGDSLGVLDPATGLDHALVLQPLACVLGTLDRLPEVPDRVAVIGLGPFGLMFAHTLKQRGARTVVGVDPIDRTAVASTFGVDEAVCSTADRWVAGLPADERFDLVLEVVGHQPATVNDAVQALAVGGRLFCFGVPEDSHQTFVLRELFRRNGTLQAGIVTERRAAIRVAQTYLAEHPELAQIVTHHFDLEDAEAAFALVASTSPDRLKVAIHMAPVD